MTGPQPILESTSYANQISVVNPDNYAATPYFTANKTGAYSNGVLLTPGSSGVGSFNGRTGTVIPLTGDYGPTQNVQSLLFYNVKDYGALGNGTHNDTVAINAAITACNAAGGGFIFMPAGTYIIDDSGSESTGAIVLLNNITLYGEGMGVTVLKLINHSTVGAASGITGLMRTPSGVSNSDVNVVSLTIDGNVANNPYTGSNRVIGFYCGVTPDIPCTTAITRSGSVATATTASTSSLRVGQTVSFYNVNQSAYFGDQVIISIPTSTTFTFDVVGTPQTPSTTNDNGLPFFYPTSAALASDYDIRCFNVEVRNCNYYGFDPHERSTRTVISNCYAHDNGTDGLVFDYQIDSFIFGGTFSNNGRHGINITTTSTNCQISTPICEENGFGALGQPGHGMVFQRGIGHIPFPTLNSVIGGSYNNNYGNGILLTLADYNTLSNPNCYQNGEQNIRLHGSRYNVINTPVCTNGSYSSAGSFDDINVSDYNITLASLTQSGGIATATTASTNNINAGDTITVTGATPTGYNVSSVQVISVLNTQEFTFAVNSALSSPATGTIQVYASYYAASNNTIAGFTSTSSVAGQVRYGLKEELSPIGSGNNFYSYMSVVNPLSGIIEVLNSSSNYGTAYFSQNFVPQFGYYSPGNTLSASVIVPQGANIIRAGFSVPAQTVTMPVMNLVTSLPKGLQFEVYNTGANNFNILNQDGTNLCSNIAPGKIVYLQVSSNSSANGSFNRIYPSGTGIKTVSATTYTLSNPNDANNIIEFTSSSNTAVGTGVAASAFPFDWPVTFKNNGTGTVTFTASSGAGETIDGQATLVLLPHAVATIYTDQVNWYTSHYSNAFTGVTAGSYTAANITVNAAGQITSAASGVGGSGTVTSVTYTGDGILQSNTPTSPVTTSGTLAATLNTQTANKVLAGPSSGSAATPTFRALVSADLPGGTGTVSSVTFTGDGTVLSSTPSSAVTTTGTLPATLKNQSANLVLAGPTTGSATAPTFRSIVASDLPISRTAWATTTPAITWFGGVAPSSITTNVTYLQVGPTGNGYCIFTILLVAGTPGTTNTGVNIDLPAGMPAPIPVTAESSNGDVICPVNAYFGAALTSANSTLRASLNVDTSSATGFEIQCAGGSSNVTGVYINGSYPC